MRIEGGETMLLVMEAHEVTTMEPEASGSSAAVSEVHDEIVEEESSGRAPDAVKNSSGPQKPLLGKRKQLNNSFVAPVNPYQLTNAYSRRVTKNSLFPQKLDAVTQRVLSGKDHKIKQLESELGVCRHKISELTAENRLLRSLNKRNNVVLDRFQNVEAELPTLLSFHNAEVRSLRGRFQKLSAEHREQARELRSKDATLRATREQLSELSKLATGKGLKERQELNKNLEEVKQRVTELEEQHKSISRQLLLEEKSFKHQMAREQKKFRELKSELDSANEKIGNLESKLKSKEKFITDHLTRKEFHQAGRSLSTFKSMSLASSQGLQLCNTGARKLQKSGSVQTTTQTSDMSVPQDPEDEDDLESELSFSRGVASSMMDHLRYSTSETEEEVSQIYRGRPISVPQLSLNTTTSSTPWAVDSRTFSIRPLEYFPPVSEMNPTVVSAQPATTSSARTYVSSGKLVKSFSTPQTEPALENHSANESQPSENNSSEAQKCEVEIPLPAEDTKNQEPEDNSMLSTARTDDSDFTNNYCKEALLAALKAIDLQQTTGEVPNQGVLITNQLEAKPKLSLQENHVDKKAELMQELFGTEVSAKDDSNRALDS